MQIVIDIPDFLYQIIQDCKEIEGNNEGNIENVLIRAVENGVVLPKGHGDLIDRNKLLRFEPKWYHLTNGDVACPKIDIDHAPTIIEADKE